MPAADACVPMAEMIKESTSRFDVEPTAPVSDRATGFMQAIVRGYILPELYWDDGITAGLLNYNFNRQNVHNDIGGSSSCLFEFRWPPSLGVFGALRAITTTWSYSSGGSSSSNENSGSTSTAGWRGILFPHARLTAATIPTATCSMASTSRGAQLASDDNMLGQPEGSARTIHGIAAGRTGSDQAKRLLRSIRSTGAAGTVYIDDLYAAGNGGDLQVTIKETDGTRRVLYRAAVNGAGAAA